MSIDEERAIRIVQKQHMEIGHRILGRAALGALEEGEPQFRNNRAMA